MSPREVPWIARSRRRNVVAASGALVLAAACWSVACRGVPRRPNVLVIVLDTTRADRCSVTGYERRTTPSLDEFARTATTFHQAWAPAGWTAPSHASLFTGLRPEHHGLWMGRSLFLADDEVTLAERLRDAGYATAAFSGNLVIAPAFGLVQGFDHVEPLFGADAPAAPVAREAHERLLRWTAGVKGPWFAFVNHFEPHLAYDPPEEAAARFLPRDADRRRVTAMRRFRHPATLQHDTGARLLDPARLALLGALYDAEIAALDAHLGELFASLEERGDLERTIVVVVGDHGENLGDHGLVGHQFSLHRTVRHVPLVIRCPGAFDSGARIDDTVRLEDVMPTLLELCDLRVPQGLDGESLLTSLSDRVARAIQGPVADGTAAQLRSAAGGGDVRELLLPLRAVFDGRYHLIQRGDGRVELYDVRADPGETRNLELTRPGVVNMLVPLLPRYD